MEKNRLLPSWPFPAYAFVPGKNPHPKKSGGHMEGEGDPLAFPVDSGAPEKSEFLKFAIDLFNHEYFWESHIYFEALWNAHGRSGPVADFSKAMIKLTAAQLKNCLGQRDLATQHLLRARELFEQLEKQEGPEFLGFSLSEILEQIEAGTQEIGFKFFIYPRWGRGHS